MELKTVAVIGSGAMGSGIAQVLSQAGLKVFLKDVQQSFIDRGITNIKRIYDSRVNKGLLSQEEADRCFNNIEAGCDDNGLEQIDLAIEAAVEKIAVKIEIFEKLDKICPARTILASNTSALSISEIAAHTKRPDKVVGMHFFNPAHVMKLVEIIAGLRTSQETLTAVEKLCLKLEKMPVHINECPGFFVNRVLFPYLNEALYVLAEGKFNAEEIDQAAADFGLPMGPLTLLDLTGVDVCADVNKFLADEYGVRFATAPLLLALLDRGFLGQKSGAGIYLYPDKKPPVKGTKPVINPELIKIIGKAMGKKENKLSTEEKFDVFRIIMPMFNEVLFSLQEKIICPKDVDQALATGIGLKRGILSLAQEHGLAWCHKKLHDYNLAYGERFRPAWYLTKLVRSNLHDFQELSEG